MNTSTQPSKHLDTIWQVSDELWQKLEFVLSEYDQKACNYLGMIKLTCALLWYRRCWRLSNAN